MLVLMLLRLVSYTGPYTYTNNRGGCVYPESPGVASRVGFQMDGLSSR